MFSFHFFFIFFRVRAAPPARAYKKEVENEIEKVSKKINIENVNLRVFNVTNFSEK